MREITFIYGLFDPQTDKLRYIGKSNNPKIRLAKHIRDAKKSTHLHRLAWIKGLLDKGLKPKLRVLLEIPRNQWQIVEKLLIAFLNDFGHPLTNMADGGLGGPTRRGYKRSDKARRNISDGLKRLYAKDEDLRLSQRDKSLEIWQNRDFREKRDKALNDPKVKRKMSESQKRRWKNQEIRDKQAKVGKENWENPELREKMANAIKNKWKDPVYREKQRQARLASWVRRKANNND